jgi:hypothetical protein
VQNAIQVNNVYNIQITSQVITNIWNIVESGIKHHKTKFLHPSTPSIILNTLKNTGRNGTRHRGNVARMVFNILKIQHDCQLSQLYFQTGWNFTSNLISSHVSPLLPLPICCCAKKPGVKCKSPYVKIFTAKWKSCVEDYESAII